MRYVILGDPARYVNLKAGNRREWDESKHVRHDCMVQLEKQHAPKPLLTGPLLLEAIFYLPTAAKSSSHLHEAYYPLRPSLANLLRFLEEVATGVIFHDSAIVAQIATSKRYAKQPRFEFTFTEIPGTK